MNKKTDIVISEKIIINKIYQIRGEKVMLDRDLAELYGVETRVLKQQVRRNIDRFPEDFMFVLSDKEFQNWRSQFVISNSPDKMGLRYPPMAFTENGVAMLSSVLNSKRAINTNIQIIRLFTKMREYFITHKDVLLQLQKMEKKVLQNEGDIKVLFDLMKKLIVQEEKPRKKIGF